jgi:hypothetical protein
LSASSRASIQAGLVTVVGTSTRSQLTASVVKPELEITATALSPAVPLWSPSMYRP